MSDLPEGWIETTLGGVAKVQTGPFGSQLHNKDYVDVGTPMITVEHIVNDKIFHTPGIPKISDQDRNRLSKYVLKEGDIVFSRVGSVDRSAYVSSKEDGWMFSGRLLRVRGNSKLINSHYLHYALTKKTTKEYIKRIAVGATMPSINTLILSEIPLIVPSLPEQKAIALILSSFDKKIELLREQNEILENITQTIFKEWFVNFNYPEASDEMIDSELGEIPKAWSIGNIGEVLELLYGKPLKTEDRTGTGFPVYGSNGIVGYHDNYLVNGPGIIVGRKGSMGTVTWCNDNFSPIDTAFYVRDKLELAGLFFHYFLLKRYNFEKIGSDSAVPGLNRNSVYLIDIIIPSSEIIDKFNSISDVFFKKIKNNASQIHTLSKTRDSLLPKLMSGEVRAKGFDQ